MSRQDQITMLLGAAQGLTKGDADTIALLVGTLTIACARSGDPIAVLQIAIDSLTQARRIAESHVGAVS